MALRQLRTAETMFIDDGLTDGSSFPPSADAVHDGVAELAKATVYDKILMSVEDTIYEVTVDASGDTPTLSVTAQEIVGETA